MKHLSRTIIAIAALLLIALAPEPGIAATASGASALSAASGSGSTASKKSGNTSSSGKKQKSGTAKSLKKGKAKSGKKSGKTSQKKETSSDVRRKEQAAEKEIKLTKEQIAENEKQVKANLSVLQELDINIQASQKKLSSLGTEVNRLNADISRHTADIERNEATVKALRSKYIAVVKKMRRARRGNGPLAFIFSSKNFYQAYRRLRYVRKFADWRRRRVNEINAEVKKLNQSRARLASSRQQKDLALAEQKDVQKALSRQSAEQTKVVADLRAHGDALRSHLAAKQAEANALQSRMAQLIAEEQAAAAEKARREAEQKRIAEQKAREAEQKRIAEQKAREAEEKRIAEEKAREQELAAQTERENAKAAKKKDKKAAKTTTKPADSGSGKSYADARKRKSRSDGKAPSSSSSTSTTTAPAKSTTPSKPAAAASGFGNMRGRLPRPVSGRFTVVNAFGRHPLPDLPDIMYDNPGIDALVDRGQSAKAVYAGTVSGVYVINGFGTVVMVNHGDYFTVYGNLASASVSKGDKVKQGQALGPVATDPDDSARSTIHFEVWKGRTKLNPSDWIQ